LSVSQRKGREIASVAFAGKSLLRLFIGTSRAVALGR
jgi:hypothetical protein